ncbi:hypothetical protein ABK040_007184 [Willaertia magna]
MAGPALGASYSKKIGFIYVFNLIVGVGALTLPKAFQKAGLILGVLTLAFNAFIAFICVTYVVEAMSYSNFLLKKQKEEEEDDNKINLDKEEEEEKTSLLENQLLLNPAPTISTPLVVNNENENKKKKKKKKKKKVDPEVVEYQADPFSILERTEIGKMTEQFLGIIGKILFYITLIIYLFGDLVIYAVSVPKSLRQVTGPVFGLTNEGTFYLYLGIFGLFVVPFCFFNFQKTKPLQYATLGTRNLALFLMIILSLVFIIQGNGSVKNLTLFDITQFTGLFGTSIYSFMCHHSLPSIVSPILNKRGITKMFAGDFLMVFTAYVLLCFVAVFAFGSQPRESCSQRIHAGPPCQIQSLLTLNFTTYDCPFIAYFLALFPVFTLTSNYPLIAITLRNNIMVLFERVKIIADWKFSPYIFSAVAAIPPILFGFVTQDLDFLVHATGGFAGLLIQFVFPTLLVLFARRKISKYFEAQEITVPNFPFSEKVNTILTKIYTNKVFVFLFHRPRIGKTHLSPFSHIIFAIVILLFSLFAFGFNAFSLIYCTILDKC